MSAKGSRPGGSASGQPDYQALFQSAQAIVSRLLLSSGGVWGAVQRDAELRDEVLRQVAAMRADATASGDEAPITVLLACAEKMNEINGESWRADPSKLKVSSFEKDEYIVKYPDLNSETTTYFRVVGNEVSVLLIE
jgi:hypothetical protein